MVIEETAEMFEKLQVPDLVALAQSMMDPTSSKTVGRLLLFFLDFIDFIDQRSTETYRKGNSPASHIPWLCHLQHIVSYVP